MQKTFHSCPGRLALALRAASLFAPAVAQGQGGVTLYGRLDVNLTRARGQKWHMDRASHSRIGLRGSEDLGGGLRVQFQLESRISLKDGAVDAARPWGRQAWLGLRGPWGALRMGRSYSPSRYAASSYDAMDGGIGTPGTRALLLGHASATFVRFENGVYYETPRLAGLALSAAVSLHAAGGAKPRRRARSLRLHYRRGAADLSVAYGHSGEGGHVASAGLAWDFGFIKPMAQFHAGTREGRRRAAWQIGLALPSGAGEWRAAFSRLDDRGPALQADRTLLALSYRHKLSRRTLLYATVAHDQARSQPGRKGIELGLRHSF